MKYAKSIIVENKDFKNEREKELDQAAYKLTDELWPILNKLDKAALVTSEIQDEYFNKYSRDDKEDEKWIWWGFERNTTLMGIVGDYIYEALREIRELEKRVNRAINLREKGAKENE